MGVVGDLNQYTQFQAAAAMRDAANNQNGAAGLGVGMGAAAMMNQMMNGAMQQQPVNVQQPAAQPIAHCIACGQPLTPGARFCPSCGAKQEAQACIKCGAPLQAGAKFCPQCGAKQE